MNTEYVEIIWKLTVHDLYIIHITVHVCKYKRWPECLEIDPLKFFLQNQLCQHTEKSQLSKMTFIASLDINTEMLNIDILRLS